MPPPLPLLLMKLCQVLGGICVRNWELPDNLLVVATSCSMWNKKTVIPCVHYPLPSPLAFSLVCMLFLWGYYTNRCACHEDEDTVTSPSAYLSGVGVNITGQVTWDRPNMLDRENVLTEHGPCRRDPSSFITHSTTVRVILSSGGLLCIMFHLNRFWQDIGVGDRSTCVPCFPTWTNVKIPFYHVSWVVV